MREARYKIVLKLGNVNRTLPKTTIANAMCRDIN
jgi:hypothetical protein